MKRVHLSRGSILLTAGLILSNVTIGQANSTIRVVLNNYDSMQNFRYYDQRGINVFETPKDNVTFQGFKVRFGAGFTQQFQSLKHENKLAAGYQSTNKLFALQSGFMTAQANLYTDVQLADGIRLNLTTYLSARHHNEAWVKGGFIQFDKLPFKGKFWDDLMKITTIKVGHFEVNYGDGHFRRPDGGHTLYNPFMEQNIMDAFATEIGGEVYLRKNGLIGMIGVTNGMIKGHVDSTYPTTADPNIKRNPSLILKGGFDKQLTNDLRLRLTGSFYTNSSSSGSGLTLYSGDRTGSNYQNVMEKVPYGTAVPAYTAMYASGRFNPGFSKTVNALMFNVFMKYGGFEVFGTLENARGRSKTETADRKFNQMVIEGVYRLGAEEKMFIGAKYNTVKGRPAGATFTTDIRINRTALAAGWFVTRNVLAKVEFVNQKYVDFPTSDHRAGGRFNGLVVEAVVGF
ncbi:MAG: hypothetical protein ACK5VH_11050 [bacterium]